MRNRVASIWISLIMMICFIVIIVEIAPVVKSSQIIYVDDVPGEGPGNPAENYTSIQDAVDNANNGDTVFVYNGTYFEAIVINKSINLIGEDRYGTIIEDEDSENNVHITADWVNLMNLKVTGNSGGSTQNGIKLNAANNCSINNIIVFDKDNCFNLLSSNMNVLSDNIVNKNRYGFIITNSYRNIIHNNIIIGQTDPFGPLICENGIYFSNSVENNISHNNIQNYYEGIYLENSNINNISENDVFNNGEGIYLDTSQNNNIIGNKIFDNLGGVSCYSSNRNKIIGNFVSNLITGVYLHNSCENTLRNNKFDDDGIVIYYGLLKAWNTHNIDTSNTVNGKPVYYWKNRTSGTIPPGAGQVILANCTNVSIINQELTNGAAGIELGYSTNNIIKNNNVSSNSLYGIYLDKSNGNSLESNNVSYTFWYRGGIELEYSNYNQLSNNNVYSNNYNGIFIVRSDNNNIIGNTIFSNKESGLYLYWSSHNWIYHNKIINNSNQAYDNRGDNFWDNGYPSGGNFWSNYGGADHNKGPNQDIPGKDGIGDTPFLIDSDSIDNYPLLEFWKYRLVLSEGWNLISIPLIQEELNMTRVVGSIDGWYEAIQWYDIEGKADLWKHHKIDKPFGNDLFELNETMGFWIHITRPGDTIFLYNGTQPTSNQTISVHPGWNLVGYPSLTSYNRTTGLNNLEFGTDVDVIQWFNATTKTWHHMVLDDHFVPGRGYWIHSKVETTWEVPL